MMMSTSEFYEKYKSSLNLENINWGLPNVSFSIKNKHAVDWYVLLSKKGEVEKDFLFYFVQNSLWKLDLNKYRNIIKKECESVVIGKLSAYNVPRHFLTKVNIIVTQDAEQELVKIVNQFVSVKDIDDKLSGFKDESGKLIYELDFEFVEELAKRMSKNKDKYAIYNWKKPIDVDSLKQSLFRHTMAIMQDDFKDEDNDFGHLVAVAANAMILHYQVKYNNKQELI